MHRHTYRHRRIKDIFTERGNEKNWNFLPLYLKKTKPFFYLNRNVSIFVRRVYFGAPSLLWPHYRVHLCYFHLRIPASPKRAFLRESLTSTNFTFSKINTVNILIGKSKHNRCFGIFKVRKHQIFDKLTFKTAIFEEVIKIAFRHSEIRRSGLLSFFLQLIIC